MLDRCEAFKNYITFSILSNSFVRLCCHFISTSWYTLQCMPLILKEVRTLYYLISWKELWVMGTFWSYLISHLSSSLKWLRHCPDLAFTIKLLTEVYWDLPEISIFLSLCWVTNTCNAFVQFSNHPTLECSASRMCDNSSIWGTTPEHIRLSHSLYSIGIPFLSNDLNLRLLCLWSNSLLVFDSMIPTWET